MRAPALVVFTCTASLACSWGRPDVGAPTVPATASISAPDSSLALVDGAAPVTSAPHAAPATPDPWFSLKVGEYDVRRAFERTFEIVATRPPGTLREAIVLCRVGVTEPAPLPTSAWDRANRRDLMVETFVDGQSARRREGPLGESAFTIPVDFDLREAAAGKKVRWDLHDRDQSSAYPYVTSIVLGSLDVPHDPAQAAQLSSPTMNVTCRGVPDAEAIAAFLPAADRALAEAESKMAWSSRDPRHASELGYVLEPAAEQIRIGSVLARSLGKTHEWSQREARLRSLAATYRLRAQEWLGKLNPAPVGTWAPVGAKVSARVVEIVCPALPKRADPDAINDDQREGCGLAVELRSVGNEKLRWNPNANGPIYACREGGPIAIETLEAAGTPNGLCVLGYRVGAGWKKTAVELTPTATTTAIVGATGLGSVLRISVGDASATFTVPPPPSRAP